MGEGRHGYYKEAHGRVVSLSIAQRQEKSYTIRNRFAAATKAFRWSWEILMMTNEFGLFWKYKYIFGVRFTHRK